jgi:hypothetical protein
MSSFAAAASEQRLRAAETAACKTSRCKILPHLHKISIMKTSRQLAVRKGHHQRFLRAPDANTNHFEDC